MLWSGVRVRVSPQPYDLNERTLERCDPGLGTNNFASDHHTYNHSYNNLQGRFCNHAHVFLFWCFPHISAAIDTHET